MQAEFHSAKDGEWIYAPKINGLTAGAKMRGSMMCRVLQFSGWKSAASVVQELLSLQVLAQCESRGG